MLGFVVGLLWVTVIAVICLAYLLPNTISKTERNVATMTNYSVQENHNKTNIVYSVQENYNKTNIVKSGHRITRAGFDSEPGFAQYNTGRANHSHASSLLSASPTVVSHSSSISSSQAIYWYDFVANANQYNLFCSGFPLPKIATVLFLKFFWNVIRVTCVVYFIWKNLIFDMQSIIVTDNWKVEDTIALFLVLSLFLSSIFIGVLQHKQRMTVYRVGLLILLGCLGCDIAVLTLAGLNEYWVVFGLAFAPLVETIFYMGIVCLSNSIFNAHWSQHGFPHTLPHAPDCYYIVETDHSSHNSVV